MVSPGRPARPLLPTMLALSVVALVPRAADAQDRVLVWSIQTTGSAEAPMLREQLYSSLAGGLAAAGLAVVPRKEIGPGLAAAPGLVGCETSTCLKRVADLLGVRRIIRAHVEIFGSSYVYRLDHVGPDGQVRQRAEGRCDVCTVAEVNEQVSQLAVRLVQSKDAPPPEPPPAPDRASGERAAAIPAATPAPSAPRPAPGDDHRRRLAPFWKWTALGASVVAVVVGASLAALDGHGSCAPAVAGGACPRLYDTGAAGWTLTAVGLAGLVGTGVWFWLDRPSADGRRATAGGVGLRLAF